MSSSTNSECANGPYLPTKSPEKTIEDFLKKEKILDTGAARHLFFLHLQLSCRNVILDIRMYKGTILHFSR